MARASKQKDLETLYRAFAIVVRETPDLYLLHVGHGDMSELLGELEIADRVIRVDYLADTSAFYHAIDVLALSSLYEGLSFAILEALAAGLPLVITDVPGNRDFLRLKLSHIWSSPAQDVGAFSRAIKGWLIDRATRRPSNHRELACKKFSFDVCYGRILELYEAAVANNLPLAISSDQGNVGPES
jgi:glycosyltransferase involved in cell wall biosynthesis